MKKLRLFMGAIALMLACVTAQAKKGDTFTIGDLKYTVLAAENQTNMTGSVSVQKANFNISGEIVIPATVSYNGYTYSITQIPTNAFFSASKITSFTVGPNVTSIVGTALERCSSLVTLLVDEQNKTFYSQNNCVIKKSNKALYCGAKTSIIPNDVKTIENHAFYNRLLESVNIPATVTKIGNSAFSGTPLTTINIPSEVRSIGERAFQECSNLQTITFDEGCKLTSVGNYAFKGCPFETITLPENVTSLGNYAFQNCVNLKNLFFNNSLETIGNRVLDGCNGIENINLPDKVKWEGDIDGFFVGCANLKSISCSENNLYYKVEDGVLFSKDMTTLYCFPQGMENMPTQYTIPDGVETIAGYAFQNCKAIKEIDIPQSVNDIRINAFLNCTFETITLPDEMQSIGSRAFQMCKNLVTIKMPDKMQNIDDYAFFGCENLEALKLPAGIPKVSEGITSYCNDLRIIKIPNSVKTMGIRLLMTWPYIKIKHFTLPSWVERVEPQGYSSTTGAPLYWLDYHSLFGNLSGIPTEYIDEVTIPAYFKDIWNYFDFITLEAMYFMGDEIPNNLFVLSDFDGAIDASETYTCPYVDNLYVKKSVYDEKYADNPVYRGVTIKYDIPVSMTNASGNPIEYKTLCRDFDVDLTHTNDNLPEGVEPLRAYLVDDVDGDLRMVFMNEIKYIPSRLKANVTDENGKLYEGIDEYVGVILRGTPGYTYYYRIGEHDYTQGAEGQWLMDDAMAYSNSFDTNNMLSGDANDEFYVYKTVENEDNNEIVNYGLNSNKFKIYNKDGWLNYNKSYLQLPKDVSAAIEGNTDAEGNANLTFVFNNADGTTDKVSSVEFNRNCESDIFYNPYGQRVNADTKGIVIKNGKKYVNK